MLEKINYLLNHFKNLEWSGPAWYRVTKTNKKGFPLKVSLVYFKPIHLGHGTETELDGADMGKLLPQIYKKQPELKDCFLGLIHSHHTMGAFLSGTDKDTALEQAAQDGLFFSTVVASEKEKFDCCLTYQDQFGFANLIEGKVSIPKVKIKVPQEWRNEAKKIEKDKKKDSVVTYVNNRNQLSLVNNYNYGYAYGYSGGVPSRGISLVEKHKEEPQTITRSINTNLLPSAWDKETKISDEEMTKFQDIFDIFNAEEMTYLDFLEEVRRECPNIDPHQYIDELGTLTT